MKGLAAVFVLGLIGFAVPAFAESPTVTSSGTVMTAILQTPEFEVDASEFDTTGEIILDVKFHNPTTKFHGLNWVFENVDADGVKPDPHEFYEKYADERRFYIYINDITNEKTKLDIDSMTVASDDEFILPHGITEKYDDRFVVEILDIDSLVQNFGTGQKIETQLKLSSPELVPGNDYQFRVYTASSAPRDWIHFTLPTSDQVPTKMPSDIKEETELYINSRLADCVGVAPQQCIQVKKAVDAEWENFYGAIEGFEFEEGYSYTLKVAVTENQNPPADASSLQYRLVEIMEKDTVQNGESETAREIPRWVKDIFKFYADGSIGDGELIGALQYLIKEGIIEV